MLQVNTVPSRQHLLTMPRMTVLQALTVVLQALVLPMTASSVHQASTAREVATLLMETVMLATSAPRVRMRPPMQMIMSLATLLVESVLKATTVRQVHFHLHLAQLALTQTLQETLMEQTLTASFA